jgi:hypothetical protein
VSKTIAITGKEELESPRAMPNEGERAAIVAIPRVATTMGTAMRMVLHKERASMGICVVLMLRTSWIFWTFYDKEEERTALFRHLIQHCLPRVTYIPDDGGAAQN